LREPQVQTADEMIVMLTPPPHVSLHCASLPQLTEQPPSHTMSHLESSLQSTEAPDPTLS
jgi:hypothetical protein